MRLSVLLMNNKREVFRVCGADDRDVKKKIDALVQALSTRDDVISIGRVESRYVGEADDFEVER